MIRTQGDTAIPDGVDGLAWFDDKSAIARDKIEHADGALPGLLLPMLPPVLTVRAQLPLDQRLRVYRLPAVHH